MQPSLSTPHPHGSTKRRGQDLALVAILLLAAFLRLYRLDAIPPGLHHDEAFDATMARDVLRGVSRPLFFVGNFGEEPLHIYVEALVFAIAGESTWSARLSSVLLGLMVIPALYFCARALFPRKALLALSAALVGAILYWALNFSRISLLTSALPGVLTLSAGALMAAYSTRALKWAALAGFLLGATLYAYLAARLWLLVPPLWAIYLILTHRQALRARLKSGAVLAVVAGLTLAPLVLFFVMNPLAFSSRAGQVLQLDSLITNLWRTAGMFLVWGDLDPRDNLSGRPALDPFLALLFLGGLAVSVRRVNQPAYAFLLIWFVVMSLPSALTEFAPNFRRAIGVMPALALLCAVGAEHASRLTPRAFSRALLVLGFMFSAWSSASAYFGEWARGAGLFYSFDVGLLQVGQKLAARPAAEQLCLSPDYHNHPTIWWAMDGRAYSTFDGRRAIVLPDSALPATCAIITYEDSTFALSQFFPNAQHLETIYDFERRPYAELYHIRAGAIPQLRPQQRLDARLGAAIRVLGYDLTRAGESFSLKIYWRAEDALRDDYTVFVHLLGPPNPTAQSPVWAQDDAEPGHGTYPTSRWRAGQTIIDQYALKIPANAPAENYTVEFGMYLLATGERLPVWVNGQRVPDDRLAAAAVGN